MARRNRRINVNVQVDTTTPASLTLRLLTMAGTAARLELERVLTLAGIRRLADAPPLEARHCSR